MRWIIARSFHHEGMLVHTCLMDQASLDKLCCALFGFLDQIEAITKIVGVLVHFKPLI